MFQNSWYQLGRALVKFYVRHVLRASITQETLLPAGAKILAANHPSTGDPAFVTALVEEQASILIKETLFKVPLFGRSLRMAGHVPVVLGNGQAALEKGIHLLKKGRTLIIFPEGAISPENGQLKAHTGVARLALYSGAPVIPVGISLDYKLVKIVPTRVEGKDEPSAWYLHGPYAMTVGKPQVYSGNIDDRDQVRQVTSQIMQQVGLLQQQGQNRLETIQRQAVLHAARAGTITRAAHWAKYSIALRVIQSMLFFLIGTAGRV
jgi:1-acyl-sn-glycerol-3-phosphate acyltransferase